MLRHALMLLCILHLASCAEEEAANDSAGPLAATVSPELPPEDAVFGLKAARIVYEKKYQGHIWHDTLWFDDWGRRGFISHENGETNRPFFSFIRNGDTVGYLHHYDSTYWVWTDTVTTLGAHNRSNYPGFRQGRMKDFSKNLRRDHAAADSAAGRDCLYVRKYGYQVWFWQGMEWQHKLAGSDLLFRVVKVEINCPLPLNRLKIPKHYVEQRPPAPEEVKEDWDPEAIRAPIEPAVCY